MKIIKTIPSDLHKKIDVSGLTKEQKKLKQYRINREKFMREVYVTLGKNLIK